MVGESTNIGMIWNESGGRSPLAYREMYASMNLENRPDGSLALAMALPTELGRWLSALWSLATGTSDDASASPTGTGTSDDALALVSTAALLAATKVAILAATWPGMLGDVGMMGDASASLGLATGTGDVFASLGLATGEEPELAATGDVPASLGLATGQLLGVASQEFGG